jgi:AcrR family transcriptional regulator
LLEAARELFASKGFAGVSRADVAKRAGYGMSTVYHHFADTRAMLLQLIDEWARTMPVMRRAAFDVGTALSGEPHRAAREYLRKTFEELRKGPSFYRVVLAESARDPEVGRHYETVRRTATSWIAELTRAGQTAGMLRSDRSPEAAGFLLNHVIESTLAELVVQQIDEELRQGVLDELAKMVCSYLVVDGLEPGFGRK